MRRRASADGALAIADSALSPQVGRVAALRPRQRSLPATATWADPPGPPDRGRADAWPALAAPQVGVNAPRPSQAARFYTSVPATAAAFTLSAVARQLSVQDFRRVVFLELGPLLQRDWRAASADCGEAMEAAGFCANTRPIAASLLVRLCADKQVRRLLPAPSPVPWTPQQIEQALLEASDLLALGDMTRLDYAWDEVDKPWLRQRLRMQFGLYFLRGNGVSLPILAVDWPLAAPRTSLALDLIYLVHEAAMWQRGTEKVSAAAWHDTLANATTVAPALRALPAVRALFA